MNPLQLKLDSNTILINVYIQKYSILLYSILLLLYFSGGVGTVGAIGMDGNSGHMISCTSTGGITGKMAGRVGDTPVVGAGGFADDTVGTISTTGHGDSIMRYCLAQKIIQNLENGTNYCFL